MERRTRAGAPGPRAGRSGFSLPEAMITLLLLSFVVAVVARLLDVGQRQQRLGRAYSQAQTDLRDSLRVALRAMRHGYSVVNPSSDPDFPVTGSGLAQVIVRVPEPGGAASMEIRFHLQGGVFYAQRGDQAAPGRALIRDVRELTFGYWSTSGTTRVAVDSAPGTATEVEVTLTSRPEGSATTVRTLVMLRNRVATTGF